MKSKCGGILFLFCMYFLTLTNVNMHCIKLFDNVSFLNNNDAIGFTFNHFFSRKYLYMKYLTSPLGQIKGVCSQSIFLTGFLDIHFDVDDFATN